ncbi:hypothetical protein GCM10009639_24680 [Kitasatospora putterlickiae]|uniref:ANTAR domain-containing protein n=1 Tax=Kitasatospora putterlickiae TaxID=221725 RepID=A0ABN1Y075_9ACTN
MLSLHRALPGVPEPTEIADLQVAATTVTLALFGSFVAEPDGVTADGAVTECVVLDDGLPDDAAARPWLDETPPNGVEVDQAVGMIMVQLGVRAGQALDRLRAHAFVHDEEIDELARQVVRGGLRFTEEDR